MKWLWSKKRLNGRTITTSSFHSNAPKGFDMKTCQLLGAALRLWSTPRSCWRAPRCRGAARASCSLPVQARVWIATCMSRTFNSTISDEVHLVSRQRSSRAPPLWTGYYSCPGCWVLAASTEHNSFPPVHRQMRCHENTPTCPFPRSLQERGFRILRKSRHGHLQDQKHAEAS